MATYRCTADELPDLFRKIEHARLDRVIATAFPAAEAGIEHLRERMPRDTGEMRDSCEANPTPRGAELLVAAPYSGVVETGSRPHTPPIGPLLAYAARKLAGGTEAEIKSFAFAIRAKIQREGTRPTFFMRSSVPMLVAVWRRIIERALRDV